MTSHRHHHARASVPRRCRSEDQLDDQLHGGTMNPTTGLTSEWTQDASYVSAAVDDVMIACAVGSGPKKEAKTTVVTLDKLQYRKPGTTTWNDVSGTIYVFNGKSVEFKAIKRPAAATWPTNKPVWGGTAGATGNGETKTVAFSTLSTNNTDYKTVTAECGDTKTANNIVFDFEGTFTPDDNCQETATKKRSTTQYGIGEGVELGFKSNPTGISAAQMGGLTWTKTGGLGSLTATANAGTGRFEAGDKPTTTNLHLTIQSGMWQGEKHSYEKMVIKPSGLRYVLVAGSVYAHPPHPVHEAGFEAHVYLDPKDVSFKNVEFLEAAATATLTGWFSAKFPTGHSVPEESRGGCTGGDVNDGTRVSSAILVRQTSGTLPAFAPGTMSVNRDQIARAGTTGEKHTISAVSFTAEVTAAGVKTVTKGSIGPH